MVVAIVPLEGIRFVLALLFCHRKPYENSGNRLMSNGFHTPFLKWVFWTFYIMKLTLKEEPKSSGNPLKWTSCKMFIFSNLSSTLYLGLQKKAYTMSAKLSSFTKMSPQKTWFHNLQWLSEKLYAAAPMFQFWLRLSRSFWEFLTDDNTRQSVSKRDWPQSI